MLVKIEDNKVYRTCLAPSLNKEEFMILNKDYLEIDFELDSNKKYKYENNKVVEDAAETNLYLIEKAKFNAEELIKKTNNFLLEDCTDEEMGISKADLLSFRKSLKNTISEGLLEVPAVPVGLKI